MDLLSLKDAINKADLSGLFNAQNPASIDMLQQQPGCSLLCETCVLCPTACRACVSCVLLS